jgi:hypothetical protein
MDELDLSKYECVYISYGSKFHKETPYSLLQRYPVFLGLYHNCISISIDAYPTYSMKELEDFNGMDVEISCNSISEMGEITGKLVDLLDKSNVKTSTFLILLNLNIQTLTNFRWKWK